MSAQQDAIDDAHGPFSLPLAAELAALGWDAEDLILGVPSIRDAWVREHGPLPALPGVDDEDVLMAVGEILRRRPEVVVDANVNVLSRNVVDYVRAEVPEVRLLIGQMGTGKRFHRALNLDISIVPCERVARALRPFVRGSVHVLAHSFNPGVLDKLGPREVAHPLIFTGALGPRYVLRHEVLMALLESTPIEAWIGLRKGVEPAGDGSLRTTFGTPASSLGKRFARQVADMAPVRLLAAAARRDERFADRLNRALVTRSGGRIDEPDRLEDPAARFGDRCHPAVTGQAYYDLVRRSGTVVHREVDELDGCGAALRLFEVTGTGAALLTDDSPKVREMFEDGKEIVLFRSPADAVEKAQWLLENPREREAIAAAGQERTLRDHTTAARARTLSTILAEELGAVGTGRLRGR